MMDSIALNSINTNFSIPVDLASGGQNNLSDLFNITCTGHMPPPPPDGGLGIPFPLLGNNPFISCIVSKIANVSVANIINNIEIGPTSKLPNPPISSYFPKKHVSDLTKLYSSVLDKAGTSLIQFTQIEAYPLFGMRIRTPRERVIDYFKFSRGNSQSTAESIVDNLSKADFAFFLFLTFLPERYEAPSMS